MKRKSLPVLILLTFLAVMFNSLMGVAAAVYFDANPTPFILGFNALACVPSVVRMATPYINQAFNVNLQLTQFSGGLLAGVNKEIWIDIIMEKFYPDGSFVNESRDLTAFVDNNTINLAEAGINPTVLINNTVYPIPANVRVDTPLALPLDTYDTTTTTVRNLETIEAAYDKMGSVVLGHKKELFKTLSVRAAYYWAATSNSTFTPVMRTTGAVDPATGLKKITLDDVRNHRTQYDLLDLDVDGRNIVLTPYDYACLENEDRVLFKKIMEGTPGFNLFGFKVFMFSQCPRFNATTGVKVAYGAAPAGADTQSSFSFHKMEVMRCQGELDYFFKLKNPDTKGDDFNFQMRALALPMRNKYMGAIVKTA